MRILRVTAFLTLSFGAIFFSGCMEFEVSSNKEIKVAPLASTDEEARPSSDKTESNNNQLNDDKPDEVVDDKPDEVVSDDSDTDSLPEYSDGEPIITEIIVKQADIASNPLLTIGFPLPEGLLASDEIITVTDESGKILETQWNPLSNWRTDGSVLHGALTVSLPGDLQINKSHALQIRKIKNTENAQIDDLTKNEIVTSGFDGKITINTDAGEVYSLSALDLLNGNVAPKQEYTHFSGALASEYIVGGNLRQELTDVEHETLQGYFHIRAYNQPVDRVHITFVLENTGVFNVLSDVVGDVELSVGDDVVYSKSSFLIGADKRYPKRFWWGGDQEIGVKFDGEYLQATKLVPEYQELTLDSSLLDSFLRSVDWNERGQLEAKLHTGGAKSSLAPLDRWAASYLISGDDRARDAMMAHADAYHWLVNRYEYAINPRDENTGFPLNLANHPTSIGRGWGGRYAIAAGPRVREPIETDIAHQPNCAFVPYLITAEFSYLENCQFWGVANWMMERPGSHPSWPRSFYKGQTRAIAWGLRNMVFASIMTPESHPLKTQLDEAVVLAADSFRNDVMTKNQLGIWPPTIYGASSTANPDDVGGKVAYAPWQDDFVTWAIGYASSVGYKKELIDSGVLSWKAKSVVERLGDDTGYCWADSAAYAIGVRDTNDGEMYKSWSEVYGKNYGQKTCPLEGTTDAGIDRSAIDYGAQISAAISVAKSTNIPGAEEAYQRYSSRATSWAKQYESAPEWALKPYDGEWSSTRLSSSMPSTEENAVDPLPVIDTPPVLTPPKLDTVVENPAASINPQDLDNLEPGHWLEIANSRLLDWELKPEDIGQELYDAKRGNTGIKGLTRAWNGGAYDTKRDLMLVWGGGHADYAGNEIYGFNVNTYKWEAITRPSIGPYDGLEFLSDGAPNSRHAYDGEIYIDGAQDKFFMLGNHLYRNAQSTQVPWVYDFIAKKWSQLALPQGKAQANTISAFDPVTGRIFINNKEYLQYLETSSGEITDQQWKIASNGGLPYKGTMAIDPKMRRLVYLGIGADYVWDISGETVTRSVLGATGDENVLESYYPGLDYNSKQEKLVAWVGGADVYVINWETNNWDKITPAADNAVTPPTKRFNGTFGRFRYVPSKDVFIIINDATENVFFYKLPIN